MKAIILISSIFYILGLKIGNKIDLTDKSDTVKQVITTTITAKNPGKTIELKSSAVLKTENDSLKSGKIEDELLERSK